MKLALINDDGKVVGSIARIEEYNLEKPLARASVIESIQEMLVAADAHFTSDRNEDDDDLDQDG